MRKTNTVIYSQGFLFSQRTQTTLGWIRAISDGQHLIYLDWNQTGWTDQDQPDNVSRETITQLTAYFQGDLRCFDLPLLPTGASQSRRRWLDVMATIPFGTTISYAALAAAAGLPPIDSIDQSPLINAAGGAAPRAELSIGDSSALLWNGDGEALVGGRRDDRDRAVVGVDVYDDGVGRLGAFEPLDESRRLLLVGGLGVSLRGPPERAERLRQERLELVRVAPAVAFG